jgi:hypothetical protein
MLGKADMFVPVEFFYCPIECRTQTVGLIEATLGESNGWKVMLCIGRINCHMLCIVGDALGNGGAFVLCMSDAVVKEQVVTLAQPL